uniref:bifunctional peptidase and arginyl-hydroxylase JMJD5-like n=1 Tax=Styela clava TaxID=7725 RepID=UPI0019392BC9|nr:bifunctional peptidase and arginyl-hydroxylase JMJD5-like [Styela clava]
MRASSIFIHVLFCVLSHLSSVQCDDPLGHLQPLGSHMPPINIDVIDTPPSPQEFLEKYVKVNKPVVIRGAAKAFDIFNTWKNDEYLREKYGKWLAPVEIGKYEAHFNETVIKISFDWFLSNYKDKELSIIRDIVSKNPMRDEISLMKSMSCGGYHDRVTNVIFIFSSGSGQSAIHWDPAENMHCLLDGTKEWTIIHRKDRHILPEYNESRVYSVVDPMRVDMKKYPVMQDMPWYHASIEAGDCLFIPNNSPHYVKSGDSRNMAVSIWFAAPKSLDLKDCPENMENLPNSVPLGRSLISRLENFKAMLYMMIDNRGDELKEEKFFHDIEYPGMDYYDDAVKVWEAIDTDDDGVITAKEIEDITDISDEVLDAFSLDVDKYEEDEELTKIVMKAKEEL